MGSRRQAYLAKLTTPPYLPPAAPTCPAREENRMPARCSCCVQRNFSKLSLRLTCPPSHPSTSSEAPGSSGTPLPDPPVVVRPLLPRPSFPGRQAWAAPPAPQSYALGRPGEDGCDRAALSGLCSHHPASLPPPRAHSRSLPPSLLLSPALA